MNTEEELIAKAQIGDKEALGKVISNNERLVWSIVRRFNGRGYDIEDLYQIGCIGFIKAIKRFDLKLEYKLSTFAVPYILGEIKRFLRDDGIIKISRSIKTLSSKIKDIKNRYSIEGKNITIKELSITLGVSEEEIYLAMDSLNQVESINEEAFEDGGSEKLEYIIQDKDSQEKLINRLTLKNILEGLNEREKKIINLRYFKDKTQKQVASMLGISQVQVSRLEKKILMNMRESFG